MTGASPFGSRWFDALAERAASTDRPSVLVGSARLGEWDAAVLAVVPDPDARFPRARHGEVGLEEGWGFAAAVRGIVADDRAHRRPIVVVVDVPSQAYGAVEELVGLHQALAAAVDAVASARRAGHPVVALIVGKAISGAFLAVGLQANRLVALDHSGTAVQVMSSSAQARITRRTPAELAEIARLVPATASDVRAFRTLGALHALVPVDAPEAPGPADVARVRTALVDAIADARADAPDLGARLRSPEAARGRALSIEVRSRVAEQWDA